MSKVPKPRNKIGRRVTPSGWALARRLYAAGLADRAIARRLGCGRTAVGDWRRREGLPARLPFGGTPATCRAGMMAARLRHGVGGIERLRWRTPGLAAGLRWEDAWTTRQADVLDALEAGPGHCAGLARRVGLQRSVALVCLRQLAARGVVTRAGRVYALAPGVARRYVRDEASQSWGAAS